MEDLLESVLAFILELQADPEALAEFVNADEAAAAAILSENDIEIDADDMNTIMPVLLELISVKTETEVENEDSFNTEVEVEDSFNTDKSDNSINDSFKVADSFNPWSAQQSLVDSPISSSAGGAGGAGGAGLLGGGSPVEILQSVVNNYTLNLNQSPVVQLWGADGGPGGPGGPQGLDAEAGALFGQSVAIEFDNNIVLGDNNAFATNGGEAFSVTTGDHHVGHVAIDGDVQDDDVHADNSVVAQKGGEATDASGNSGQLAFDGGEIDDDDVDASGNTGQQAFNGGEIDDNDETNVAGDDLAHRGGEIDNSVDNSLEAENGSQIAAGDAVKIEAEEGSQVGDNELEVEVEVGIEDSFTNEAVNSFNEETAIVGPNEADDDIDDNEAEVED